MRRAVCVLLSACWGAAAASAAPRPPNIIFILADDQGVGDVSALNPESKIRTPNLDRLAAEGMVFTDAHSSSGVCTPSRYSLLTGRYHWRTSLQKGVLGGFSPPLVAPDRLTVAGLLKKQGYRTACVGKWHLGMDWVLQGGGTLHGVDDVARVDFASPVRGGPADCGFDSFFGISASLDMPPYVFIRDRQVEEIPTVEKDMGNPKRSGPASASFEAVDVLPRLTQEAVEVIGRQAGDAERGRPFFLYFPLNAPHTPIVPAAEWKGKSGINDYADFVMQVDATVGRVLDALDRHGLAENTLVIFSADNGCSPAANMDELEAAGHSPSGIRRGHKADLFEGGHRVPFIVRWPAHVKAGSRSDALVGQIDFFATVAEITGAEVPPAAAEDSLSFLPLLLGRGGKPLRDSLVVQGINGHFSLRQGKWKLLLTSSSGGWSDPKPGSAAAKKLPPVQLYDLAADPGETRNLAGQQPERVDAMTRQVAELIARGRTTLGPGAKNDADVVLLKDPSPGGGTKRKGAGASAAPAAR